MEDELITRYLPLIDALEETTGYGQYVVTLHGKRPVKIQRISRESKLEICEDLDI